MTASWLPLGTNMYRVIGDLIEIELHAQFTMDDAVEYVAMLERMRLQHGYTLSLFNMKYSTPLAPEVRKYVGQYGNNTENPAGIATFGGSIAQRLLGRLMIRGINLFRKSPLEVDFLDDEATAYAWLQNRRHQIKASLAA